MFGSCKVLKAYAPASTGLSQAPYSGPNTQTYLPDPIMIYQAHISETNTSLDTPVLSPSTGEMHSHLEAEGSSSGLNLTVEQQHHSSNVQRTTAADTRPGTAGSGWSMASSVHHRRALPTPNGSVTIVNAITPTIFRDTEEDTDDDDEAHSTQDPPKDRSGDTEWASWITTIRGPLNADPGYIGTTGPHASALGRWSSKSTSNLGPPKLPSPFRGIWRLFLFQGTTTTSPNSKRKRSAKSYEESDEDSDNRTKLTSKDANRQTSSHIASPSKKARSSDSDETRNSARKAKSPSTLKAQNSTKPPATDLTTWRNSQVPPLQQITAGRARARYRLRPSDLKDLRKDFHPVQVEDKEYISHLYNEREVERVAWTKHGSPEGWDAYLQKLRVRHDNATRKNKKRFCEPSHNDPGVYSMSAISQSLHPDVAHLKSRFPQRWIFSACWEHQKSREYDHGFWAKELLQLALSTISKGGLSYPHRPPNTLLPPSSSVNQLRDVLNRAPRPPECGYGDAPPGMRSWEENFPNQGDVHWYWASAYLDEVNKALIAVIKEHGVGKAGWSTARWEVYDKVS
ncbi:hypothetical protein HWV62_16918 [Athelia sp. TMB]|nr:hypothetical protein HWV62_16918 [Athelia sp. TMB]